LFAEPICFPTKIDAANPVFEQARILLGLLLDTFAVVMLGRVAGAGLLALGVAGWLARDDTQSRAARGLVAAMLLYNVATVAVLAFHGIDVGLHGVALWPAVVLHAVMAVWCAACLRRSPPKMNRCAPQMGL
jgi:hypothetical protein